MRHPANMGQSFPRKLWEILENEDPDIVGWSDSGKSFFIRSMDLFIEETLTKYFRHNKFSSFQRQLNLYGFKKVIRGSDLGAYSMKLFQRANPEALTKIKRSPQPTNYSSRRRRNTNRNKTSTSSSSSSSSSSSDNEEDSDEEDYKPRNFVGDCFTSRGRRIRAARSLADEQAEEVRRLDKQQRERHNNREEQEEKAQSPPAETNTPPLASPQFPSPIVHAAAMARLRAPSAVTARTPTETMTAYRQYDTQFLARAGVAPSSILQSCSLSSEYLDKKLAELGADHPYSQSAMQAPVSVVKQQQFQTMPLQAATPVRPMRSASNQSIEPIALDELAGDFANRSSIGNQSIEPIVLNELPVAVATPMNGGDEQDPTQTAVPIAAASFRLPATYSRSNSMEPEAGFLQDLTGDLDAFWGDGKDMAAPEEAILPTAKTVEVAGVVPVAPAPVPAPMKFVSFNPMSMGATMPTVTMPSAL